MNRNLGMERKREKERGKGIDITRQDTNDEKIKPMYIKENDINE